MKVEHWSDEQMADFNREFPETKPEGNWLLLDGSLKVGFYKTERHAEAARVLIELEEKLGEEVDDWIAAKAVDLGLDVEQMRDLVKEHLNG